MTEATKRPWRVGWWARVKRADRTEWYVFSPPPVDCVRDDVCFHEIHRAEYGDEHHCSNHCEQDSMVVGTVGEYSETVLSITPEDAEFIVRAANCHEQMLSLLDDIRCRFLQDGDEFAVDDLIGQIENVILRARGEVAP